MKISLGIKVLTVIFYEKPNLKFGFFNERLCAR